MKQPKEGTAQAYYEDYWKAPAAGWTPIGVKLDAFEQRLIEEIVPRQARVLDFGCGDGSHLGPYLAATHREYVGADVSAEAVALCRSKGLEAVQCSADETLPWPAEAFDAAVSFEVLEHLFRPDVTATEIHRVLRVGGHYLGSVPNAAFFGNRVLLALGYVNPGGSPETSLRSPWRDAHIRFFTRQSLREMLRQVGFADVQVLGARFTVRELPVLYRSPAPVRRMLDLISRPFGGLGSVAPGFFSHRLYFVARK